jgi:hypothetical protein
MTETYVSVLATPKAEHPVRSSSASRQLCITVRTARNAYGL